MIGVVGINHKTAPQDIRTQFYMSEQEVISFGQRVQREHDIDELVVLSTCNRTELYFVTFMSRAKASKQLLEALHEFKQLPEDYSEIFYHHQEHTAVKHLFEVTSGVDSMVLGEDQIVGQVKQAYLLCTKSVLTGATLMRLFQKSFETAKRVRTDTHIQQGATSISFVSVDLCESIDKDFREKRILIVGTGETGLLVLQNLHKRGCKNICLTNRTDQVVKELKETYQTKTVSFSLFKKYLADYDIIFVATGYTDYLLTKKDIKEATKSRKDNLQIIIDMSMPRNVEPGDYGDYVQTIDLDKIQSVLGENSDKRKGSLAEARAIIQDTSSEYMKWVERRQLIPLIKSLTENLNRVKEQELKKYQKGKNEASKQEIEECVNLLTRKYIRYFIKNLNDNPAQKSKNIEMLTELFRFD